jgi:hypothetical protein
MKQAFPDLLKSNTAFSVLNLVVNVRKDLITEKEIENVLF